MRAPAVAGFACFDTALGTCAIAWGEQGIVGSQLPEADAAATRARMQRRFPALAEGEPPPAVRQAIAGVQALLRGEPANLDVLTLDMSGHPEFHRRAWTLIRSLRPGQTATYGEIAERLGEPGAARSVGRAMGDNPFAPIVPCHRVHAAGGAHGGFSAPGGVHTKLRMLAIEGAAPGGQGLLF